jgi:hypothetical protein
VAENTPTNDVWRGLYEAAVRVKEMAPWEWMTEAHVFGVQDPETREIGFVSVMGMLGEYYAISVYPNPEALYSFWMVQEAGPDINPDALLEIPQIHASFEDRGDLENKDRQVIKDLGLKFRGRKEWPMFRSYRPGYAPWFVEAEEARLLTNALDQLTDVAPRFREDPFLLEPPGEDSYLVRVPREEGGALVWEDHLMEVPPSEPSPIEIEVDFRAFGDLEGLACGGELEMDFFMLPTPVMEGKDRPFFPYMLLTVDTGSGMVLGHDLLTADPSLEAMWASIPQTVAEQFAATEIVPEKVTAGSELLYGLLQPLAESFDFELVYSDTLLILDQVREFMLQSIE